MNRLATLSLAVILASTSMGTTAQTVTSPRLAGALDYASAGYMPKPPTTHTNWLTGGASVGWKNNLQCGNLDPQISVSNQLNGLTKGFQQLFGNILQAATAAVASLPALILQRSNPGLYDLISQGTISAKADFDQAEWSCEAILGEIDKNLPWGGMRTQGANEGWGSAVKTSHGDAMEAKEKVRNSDPGDRATTWICDRPAGGPGEEPVRTTEDVVKVGYNTLLQRYGANQCSNNGVTGAEANSPMAQYWPMPSSAIFWATDVLGDTYLQSCDDCSKPYTIPGQGLVYQLKITTDRIDTGLNGLVSGTTSPITYAKLADVSAPPGVMVTGPLIRQIANMDTVNQDATITKLAGELAYARLVEQTRIMIQILRTGKKDDAVQANPYVIPYVDSAIETLESELRLLDNEMVTRKMVAKSTISQLLGAQEQHIQQTTLPSPVNPATINTIGGGSEL